MKKTLVAIAATAILSTSAMAADLAPGLSLDTEVKAFHKVDAETNHITIEPELKWTPTVDGPLSLTVGSVITAYDSSTAGDDFVLFDILDDGSHPDIDLGAYYAVNASTTFYGETKWDLNNSDRKEIEVGVSVKF